MEPQTRRAAQPFTFAGVARYAYVSPRLFFIAALFTGLLCGASVAWTVWRLAVPVIDHALATIPPSVAITEGNLRWPESGGRSLAGNGFLSISVRYANEAAHGPPADFTVELHERQFSIGSILGRLTLDYPLAPGTELKGSVLAPFWGAWKSVLLTGLGLGVALGIVLFWCGTAILYATAVFFLAGLLRRDLTYGEGWKMSIAAQWTGALIMSSSLLLYSTGEVTLLFLIVMLGVHFVPTVFYLLISPIFLRRSPLSGGNPFEQEKRPKSRNPFSHR